MESTIWLACKAVQGLLLDEVAVLVSTADGRRLSLFVAKDRVRFLKGNAPQSDLEVDAQIPVQLIDRNQSFGLVTLPAEPIEGSRVAKVSAALLATQ